jgi:uncharacterized protein
MSNTRNKTSKIDLISILKDWNFWDNTPETGYPRAGYLSRLAEFLSSGQITVLTGPRRAGKSYLMRQMAEKLIQDGVPTSRILIVNFEDPRFGELDSSFLESLFQAYLSLIAPTGKPYLLFDEIQEVEGWEKWVSTIHALNKAFVVVTGSNAKVLSRELGTALTGRHLEMTVFPLSFREFQSFGTTPSTPGQPKRSLREYLEWGGFPAVTLSAVKKEMLLGYFSDIINRDILQRYKIRKPEAIRALSRYYLSNISALSTFHSIEKHLGISRDTVEKFTAYMEHCYLIFSLKRFSFKINEQEKSPRKIYCIDSGLCNAAGFRFLENMGRLAENVVFLELKRRQALDPDMELFYWKDPQHREVDFLSKKGMRPASLIQVSWDISNANTKDRETRVLERASKELGIKKVLVLARESAPEETAGGIDIQYRSIEDWLAEAE